LTMTTMGPRDASEASLTAPGVESLAQNVILHFGLPFTVPSLANITLGPKPLTFACAS
jgi:hypothetical protein